MKKKNLILTVAIAVCFIACILLLLVNVFDLNIIKHHDIQIGDLIVKYYGNFKTVKTVKIYDGSIRRGTFELSVDNEIIENSNEYPPYLEDINMDGHEDVMIPHSKDASGTPRYAVYLWNNDIAMFEECSSMLDIANLTKGDDNSFFSSMTIHKVIYEAQINIPEIYEEHKINTEYKLIDGKLNLIRNYTLVYYSSTDAYCYITTDYDATTGEIISSLDDWMSEEEASQVRFYN